MHPQHDDLAARMENYELAFRMQMEVPETLSIEDETQSTLDNYGVGAEPTVKSANSAHSKTAQNPMAVARGRVISWGAPTW